MMNRRPTAESENRDWDPNAHYQDTKVASEYDAVRFESIAGRVFNKWEQNVIRRAFAGVGAGATIADIPCGTGRLAEPLLAAGYRVHGMDISPQMLDVARQRLLPFGDRFTTEVADVRALDRTHQQYDAALCARVLMHFPLEEQIEFLRGVAKITSGRIVISHSLNSPYQRLRRGVKAALRHPAPARHPVTVAEIDQFLSAAGLRQVRHYRLNPFISEAIYVVCDSLTE